MARRGKGGKKPPSLPLQIAKMRHRFPGFVYKGGRNAWCGTLQPTKESPAYRVKLEYNPGRSPKVWVLEPRVHPDAPHRYRDESLCLYHPRDGNWNPSLFLADTIVPWAAEWLFYYEVWLEDPKKRWFGPEAPHEGPKKRPQ